MFARRQAEIEAKSKRDTTQITSKTSIYVAVIASITALASMIFTYIFTERVRTQISSQTLALDVIKVDISKSAQRTSESLAAIEASRLELQRQAASIDSSRLDLQRQIASTTNLNEIKKIDLDSQRKKADEIRLMSELAKAKNDLIPTVDYRCNWDQSSNRPFKIDCNFNNKGINRITITPIKFELIDTISQSIIENGIYRVENAEPNTLPPSITGSNTYDIYLSEIGGKYQNITFRLMFTALTDQVAVNNLYAISKGLISKKELESFQIQQYTYKLKIN